MALSAGQVSLSVKPDTSKFGSDLSSGIGGQSGLFDGVGKKIGGLVLGGVAALGIGKAIGSIFSTGFDEAKDASAGIAQLTAGIKSTGNAANVSVDGMEALASSIQGMSGQTDDSIVKAEQLLLTFTNIKNVGPDKIFDQATQAAADMAAKMGGDASSNAVLLGKALNDPVKGVTALTRVGVSFTQAQKDSIAAMVASGNTMGAQKLILGELQTEFGGAAKAAGESLPGQLARTRRAFEDITQSLVEGFIPVFTPMMGGVVSALQRATPYVQAFSSWMGDNVPAAMSRAHDALVNVRTALSDTFAILSTGHTEDESIFPPSVTAALQAFHEKIVDVAAALGPAFASIGAAFAPLIPQLLGLWQAVSPLSIVFQALMPILPAVAGAFAAIAIAVGEALVRFAPAIEAISAGLVTVISGLLATLLPMLTSLAQWIGDNSTMLLGFAFAIGAAVLAFKIYETTMTIVRAATAAWAAVQAGLNIVLNLNPIGIIIMAVVALVAAIVWVATQTTFFQDVWRGAMVVMGAIMNWLWASVISPVVGFIVERWNFLGAVVRAVWSSLIQPAINALGAGFQWASGIVSGVVNGISSAIRVVGDTVRNVFGGIGDFIGGAFRTAANLVRGPMNTIIGLVNGAIDGVNSVGGAFGVHINHIPMLAKGGTLTSSGSVIVGENGPELLTLPRGATVNPDIRGASGGAGGMGSVSVTQNIEVRDEDSTIVARKFGRELVAALSGVATA